MAISTSAELHAQADLLWRSIAPDDAEAARSAAAIESILLGRQPVHFRATNWGLKLHRYEGYWFLHGRTPRENTRNRDTLPATERNLGEWARYQRRFEDQLNEYQHARLEVSPAFRWDPWSSVWQTNLAACIVHRERAGSLPRLTSADSVEFALARWLGRQLYRLQRGHLVAERAELLQTLLRSEHGSWWR